MQRDKFIYHARDGKLSKVAAEKALLPHDPKGHPQCIHLAQSRDGTLYVQQETLMSRSTDGGRTWEAYETGMRQYGAMVHFNILEDGTFITARHKDETPGDEPSRVYVWTSQDEGRSSTRSHEIPNPENCPERYANAMTVLADGTWLTAMESRAILGHDPTYVYVSKDRGKTWLGPTGMNSGAHFLGGKCYETMIVEMPSGKLQAVIRYHGPLVPCWPCYPEGKAIAYKTIFLADSFDGGVTWRDLRPLTSVHGQCHGVGLSLDDGTVIVTHDHRYTPGTPCNRAMISRDEGATWQDEAYYLLYGMAHSGFSQSTRLPDGTILTVGCICEKAGEHEWYGLIDNTDCWAIRWQPAD